MFIFLHVSEFFIPCALYMIFVVAEEIIEQLVEQAGLIEEGQTLQSGDEENGATPSEDNVDGSEHGGNKEEQDGELEQPKKGIKKVSI